MTEREWVKSIIGKIESALRSFNDDLRVMDAKKLPYSREILSYNGSEPEQQSSLEYETDILVYEVISEDRWKPRVIVEAKIRSVTTHDAITYSQKAQNHKNVHPYLRYGILIGMREHYPLPGRLFRHGQNFDFMQSWVGMEAGENEWSTLIDILRAEVKASKALEEIIFNSRSKTRERYTVLHSPLIIRE